MSEREGVQRYPPFRRCLFQFLNTLFFHYRKMLKKTLKNILCSYFSSFSTLPIPPLPAAVIGVFGVLRAAKGGTRTGRRQGPATVSGALTAAAFSILLPQPPLGEIKILTTLDREWNLLFAVKLAKTSNFAELIIVPLKASIFAYTITFFVFCFFRHSSEMYPAISGTY